MLILQYPVKNSANQNLHWTTKSVTPFAKSAKAAPLSVANEIGVMFKKGSRHEQLNWFYA